MTLVLATREKLGAASPHTILPLADIQAVVTEAAPQAETLLALRSAGVAVVEA